VALKRVGVELVADDGTKFIGTMQQADDAVQQFGRNAEQASGGVSSFGEIAVGALRKVGAVAVEMAAQAGKAIIGFISDSVDKAGDFQAGMSEFAAVTGDALKDSGKSVKDFSKLFIKMGRELPVSTAEVQQAAIELAKGGIDPATIAAGGLRTSLDLAAAGGVDLADSANILAKQLGVWVDAAADADTKSQFLTETANLLSQAANVTTSDVSEMALGLANAGGTAKTAGLDYQELVQTMALVSPGFSSAADAGTSLKTFLSRLIPSTDAATGAMIDLGLATKDGTSKFYDATGSFIGMQAAADLLQQSTAGLSEAQRLQSFQTIFGADAIRVAAAVAEKGGAGFAAMGAQMAAAGTVAEQAAARQQGFNTALENAKGSVEALQLTIGTYLLPVLASLLNDYISPAINKVTEFADAFLASTDKLGMVTSALDTLSTTIGNWIVQQTPIWAAKLGEWAIEFVQWILPKIPTAIENLGKLIGAILGWTDDQVDDLNTGTAKWAPAFYEWIEKDAIPQLSPAFAKFDAAMGQLLTDFINRTTERWAEGVRQWWYSILDAFEQGVYHFRDVTLQEWADAIFTWLNKTAAELPGRAAEMARSIITGIHNTMAELGPELDGWATSIFTWANETGVKVLGWVRQIGTNMILGMVNGVKEQAAALGVAAAKVVTDAIAAAKRAVGIKSPSTMTRDEIGKPIVQGIMLGINDTEPALKRRLVNLGAAMPPAIAAGITAQQPSPVKQALLGHLADPSLATEAAEKARNLGALVEKHVVKGLMEQAEEFRRNLVNLGAIRRSWRMLPRKARPSARPMWRAWQPARGAPPMPLSMPCAACRADRPLDRARRTRAALHMDQGAASAEAAPSVRHPRPASSLAQQATRAASRTTTTTRRPMARHRTTRRRIFI
jgi:TP901 family phage tail tape measure protein